MVTTAEITARLEKLRSIRGRGVLSTTYDGERVEYRTDAELASAIADLERQLGTGNGATLLYVSTSKGL